MDFNISKSNILPFMREFYDIYKNRPIKENNGGMKATQCFWAWYLLKMLNPEVVIESGIWLGQSTWLIETACPNARILSIDINLNIQQYRSKKATYSNIDFNNNDWTTILGKDTCKNTVAFIDDHQDNYERLKHGFKHNIGHMIFEDNYPTNQGDILSLKKILSADYHTIDLRGVRTRHTIPPEYKNNLRSMCEYFECPPIFLDTNITRWGDTFAEHNCKDPLFTSVEEDIMKLYKNDQLNYNYMCIVRLNL
jgi:hypothetical protein